MSSLHTLVLDGNRFNSTLDEILNCGNCVSSLVNLKSRLNGLVGEIPEKLFDFTELSALALAKSRLTGTIPSGFGKLTELMYLDLTENFYLSEGNAVLPSEMGSLTKLTTLRLSDSAVGGTVPQEFSNLSNLETLWIVRTSLTGSIPDEICAIDSLKTIQYSGVDCSCPGNICEFFDV
jgi:Leucine-rich repeat (LRR) protein